MRPSSSDSPPRPWYREPWPWILMAGPAAAIAAGLFTLALALRTEDGLVAEDYYRQGLAINRELRREARARELGLSALVAFEGSRLAVTLAGQSPPALRLRLIHPVRAGGDQSVVLRRVGVNEYEGHFDPSRGGRRRLLLEDPGASWRLDGNWNGTDATASLAAR
jgi:uncharacterized protein